MNFQQLYERAQLRQVSRTVSPFITAGAVSTAILSGDGNIYTGVCIDSACSLGMCAERNAIANMITNGEHEVTKLVTVMPDGKIGMPCGACIELLMQLHPDHGNVEVLADLEDEQTIRLAQLIPTWWGKDRH